MRVLLVLLILASVALPQTRSKPICNCGNPFTEVDRACNPQFDWPCVDKCYAGASTTCSSQKHCGSWAPSKQKECCQGKFDSNGNLVKKGCCYQMEDICLGKCLKKSRQSLDLAPSGEGSCEIIPDVTPVPLDADIDSLLDTKDPDQVEVY